MKKPRDVSPTQKAAREMYDEGASLRRIARKFNMNDGELRDCFPWEFEDDEAPTPATDIGGY